MPPHPESTAKPKEGVRWTVLGQLAGQILAFASAWLIARFLGEQSFGIVAFAYVVLQQIDYLVDFGTGMAVVQRDRVTRELLDTAFALNLVFAALGTAVLVGLGFAAYPFATASFDGPTTAMVLWELSLASVLTALVTVPRSLLLRELRLDTVAKVQFAMNVIRSVVAVALAAAGFGVQSVVVAYYASVLVGVVSFRVLVPQPLRFRFHREERGKLLHFGARLSAHNLLHGVLQRADAFLLPVLVGQGAFGTYALARQLLIQPVEIAGGVLRSIVMPRLARLQGRPLRGAAVYLRAEQLAAGMLVPILVTAAVLMDQLAAFVLPPEWDDVGHVALALLPVALAGVLLQGPGSVLIANGRTGLLFRWGVIRSSLVVLACLAAPTFGLIGMALALAALNVAAMPLLLRDAMALLQRPWHAPLASVANLLPAALLCGAAVYGVERLLLHTGVDALPTFFVAGFVGVIAFATVAYGTRAPVAEFVRRRFARRRLVALQAAARPASAP